MKRDDMRRQYSIKILLKKKNIKSFIHVFFSIFIYCSSVAAKKPEYYSFTSYIYNQDEVLERFSHQPHSSEEEINNALKAELLRRKEAELDKNCLTRMRENIKKLEQEVEEAQRAQFIRDMTKHLQQVVGMAPFVGVMVGESVLSEIGGLCGLGIGVAAQSLVTVASTLIERYINNTMIRQTDPQIIIKEWRDLSTKYADLKSGLQTEPVSSLESQYVCRKRSMSKDLNSEIERSLIEARLDGYFLQLNLPSVGRALGLPLGPKPLLDENSRWRSVGAWIEKFEGDESFSIYTDEIKEKLLEIINQIATNSVTTADNPSPLRVVAHWWGSGSTGKSTAAKAIARFFGLPYFEERITTESEISTASITGALRSIQGESNIGWLAKSLLQQVEGESYQNCFLILDDFPVNTPNGQSILLNITDPDKRTCRNHNLQTDLNISRLNVFIISNENLRSLKQTPQGSPPVADPTFLALTTRFESRLFPEFNETQKRRSLVPYLATLVRKHKIPNFHGFQYLNPRQLRIEYDADNLRDMGLEEQPPRELSTGLTEAQGNTITVRELKRVLEQTISNYIIAIIREGNQLFAESSRFLAENQPMEAENALKAAARSGHPEAIDKRIEQTTRSQNDIANRVTISRTAQLHEMSGNSTHAKKWWLESLVLDNWDISPEILPYLPYKLESVLDQELVEALLRFPENNEVGRESLATYLCNLGVYLREGSNPDFTKAREYLSKAVRLRSNAAQKALYELAQKIEEKYGFGNLDAVASYTLLSESRCMISGVPRSQLGQNTHGVMTLCFVKSSPVLLFEMFLPRDPSKLSLRMVSYDTYEKNVQVKDAGDTFRKTLKEQRYASWILPNNNLLNGLGKAENDERSLLRYPDEFKCVEEIMGISGLQKLHFGTWMKTAPNLKTLVDRYVAPPPTYKKDTFPPHQWNNE